MNINIIMIAIGFFSVLILTYLVRIYALRKNIVDTPNARSSHTVPTPRGGGVAIAIVWYSLLVILFFLKKIEFHLFAALMSGIILSMVSLLDDLKDLSPKIRLLAQFASAALALYFLGGLSIIDFGYGQVSVPTLFSIVIFLWILWMINLFNFLDGTDGYLGMEGIFVIGGIFLLTGNKLALTFTFLILGFLFWNWPKAKIFCGDIGSTLIGFTISIFTVYFQNQGELSFLIPVILSGLFWFDASITLFRRWRNKEKLSEAHKKHAYQRLNQSGFSHLKVLITGVIVNIILLGIGYIAYLKSNLTIPLFIIHFILLLVYYLFIERRKKFN